LACETERKSELKASIYSFVVPGTSITFKAYRASSAQEAIDITWHTVDGVTSIYQCGIEATKNGMYTVYTVHITVYTIYTCIKLYIILSNNAL